MFEAVTRDPVEVARRLLDEGLAAARATDGTVLVRDEDARRLVPCAGEGDEVPLDAVSPVTEALRTGELVFVESPAIACLPLPPGPAAVGVLVLGFGAPRRFTAEDEARLREVADLGGLALERALACDAERLASRRARLLAEASRRLSDLSDAVSMLETVAALVVPELADWCAVELLEGSGPSAGRLVAVRHVDPDRAALARALWERPESGRSAALGISRVLATGKGELLGRALDDLPGATAADRDCLRDLGLRSAIIVPIRARGRTFGTMTFVLSRGERRFGRADLALAEDLGGRVGAAVDDLRRVRALEADKARLCAIVASAMDAIITTDGQQRIVIFNAAAEKMFRCKAADAVGTPLSRFIPERYRAVHADQVRRFGQTGATRRSMGALGTLWGLRADGEEFPVEAAISRIAERGGVFYTVILRDVTERFAQQRALDESARQKDKFLAVLAHELRNPLAAVQSALEMSLGDAPTTDPATALFRDVVGRQVTHMARLIDDLLDVSRIAHGKVELVRETLDLRDVVGTVISDRRSAARSRQVSLDVHVPDAPVWVNGDRARLVQVLDNLVDNALKFTKTGDSVVVSLRSAADGQTLEVSDTGMGMSPDVVAHVFEPFRQADTSLGRAAGGLGLGLSLVHDLVELHGGRVTAESRGPESGSTFVVRLPPAEPPRPVSRPPSGEADLAAKRVLIVEDHADTAALLRKVLLRIGLHVEVAHTGEDALACYRTQHPDAVVCDIGLPGEMTGYDVARAIRGTGDDAVALVALTGYGRPEDRDLARSAGFDAHLTKPVDLATLRSTLATLTLRG